LTSFRHCADLFFARGPSKDYPMCLCFLTRNPLIATSFHILYFFSRALSGTVPALTARAPRLPPAPRASRPRPRTACRVSRPPPGSSGSSPFSISSRRSTRPSASRWRAAARCPSRASRRRRAACTTRRSISCSPH
jgi:hypothetical protein